MTRIHHLPHSGKHLPQPKMRDETAVRSSLETRSSRTAGWSFSSPVYLQSFILH